MSRIITPLIILLVLASCTKDFFNPDGIDGGDIFYKDSIKLNLLHFDSSTSLMNIDIKNHPLPIGVTTCSLFISYNIAHGAQSNLIAIDQYTSFTSKKNYYISSPDISINDIFSETMSTDSAVQNANEFNFAYLFIKYNNRKLIISDSIGWKNSTIVNPL